MLFVEGELSMTVSYDIGGTWRKPAGGSLEYKQTQYLRGRFPSSTVALPALLQGYSHDSQELYELTAII